MAGCCRIGHIVAALAALLVLAGCGRAPEPPASPPLRVGAYYWPGEYWVDIAHRKGWFKEAGLNVEWVDTNADYFASLDALAEGRLDIVDFTLFDLVRYNAQGRDIVGFLASDLTAGAEALVARPGIKSVRDLAGRRLGVREGTYLDYLWTILSSHERLHPGAVRLVDITPEKAPEALANGTVDAVMAWEPLVSQALAAVNGRKLFDTSQAPGISWSVHAARRETVEKRASDLAAFTRVWRRTAAYLKEHPDEALALVAEVNRRPLEEVRAFMKLDRVLDLRDNETAFSFASGFESLHGTARRMNDYLIEHGMAASQANTARMLEPRFIRELEASP